MIKFNVKDCGGVGLRVRSGPSTSYPKTGVPNLKDNAQNLTASELIINDNGEKWLQLADGGYCSADWVDITDAGNDMEAEVVEDPTPPPQNNEPVSDIKDEDSTVKSKGLSDAVDKMMEDKKSDLANAIDGSVRLFGLPHQLLAHNDVRISKKTGLGRMFAENIVMESPTVYIKPGGSKFLPGMTESERDSLKSSFMQLGSGDSIKSEIISKALGGSDDTIKYYEFREEFGDYMKKVNLLCRMCATFLGIDKVKFPWAHNIPIGYYNWSYYRFDSSYESSNPTLAGGLDEKNTGIGGLIEKDTMENIASAIMRDNQWVKFYIDAGSSTTESASNSSTQSVLESYIEKLEGMSKELAMFSGMSGVDIQNMVNNTAASIDDLVQNTVRGDGAISSFFRRITGNTKQILSGGNLLVPEIWNDSNYSKSYNFTINLSTPYGNPLSWYLNIGVPLMHILAFSLPSHLSVNTYRQPFFVKAFSKGRFSCSLGMVKSLSIEKGGSGDAWAIGGLPNEVKVSLSIDDLYSRLALSAPYRPNDFLSDSGMCEFLMATCGCDITRQKITEKFEVVAKLLGGSLADSVSSVPYDVVMKFKNATQKLFKVNF